MKQHRPKLTVFRASANRSATLTNTSPDIAERVGAGVTTVKDKHPAGRRLGVV
jgi:hypothetical protein